MNHQEYNGEASLDKTAINYKALRRVSQKQAAIDKVKYRFFGILGLPAGERYNDYSTELIDAMALEIAKLTGQYSETNVTPGQQAVYAKLKRIGDEYLRTGDPDVFRK